MERGIEFAYHLVPIVTAFGNFVELFFDIGRKVVIHDGIEVF
jgi:hypothetical protein